MPVIGLAAPVWTGNTKRGPIARPGGGTYGYRSPLAVSERDRHGGGDRRHAHRLPVVPSRCRWHDAAEPALSQALSAVSTAEPGIPAATGTGFDARPRP